MSGNIIGKRFTLTYFGESHGNGIGAVVGGCPPGLKINAKDIQKELDLRRPGTSKITTARSEKDRVEILSGILNGRTTGAPIAMIIKNKDTKSQDYDNILTLPRPGHADFPAWVKYGGYNDIRGGGQFSARLTAAYVMAGAIAKKLLSLHNIEIIAYVSEIGGITSKKMDFESAKKLRYSNEVRCPDKQAANKMKQKIIETKKEKDSLGGIIECKSINLPIGIGNPRFSSIDSDLGRIIFSIPAVKGIEFGSGFSSSKRKGSQNNDQYKIKNEKIISITNNSGGILGGLTTGMPLTFRAAFKPPSSISKEQKSVNLKTKKEEKLIVKGRHDPCVLPRAVPIVEAVTALVIVDHVIDSGIISNIIKR